MSRREVRHSFFSALWLQPLRICASSSRVLFSLVATFALTWWRSRTIAVRTVHTLFSVFVLIRLLFSSARSWYIHLFFFNSLLERLELTFLPLSDLTLPLLALSTALHRTDHFLYL